MDHYDVVVIGSGAGGGTLTYALAPTGLKVLLLERGDASSREPENWSPEAVWAKGRYRNSGMWTDASNGEPFRPKQAYWVGGNTKVYGAVLFRFREHDFGEIRHVDGISPAWPIGYADLEPWYTRAEKVYRVHGERGVDPLDPPSDTPYPYPALPHEPRIALLEDDLRAAGLTPFPLPVGVLRDEASPHTSRCVRCQFCDGFPCPLDAKADAETVCVTPALRHENVTLRTRARVVRLETDEGGRRVSRVVVDRDGEREEYSADVVVVSCGAIGSAALLLASASDDHPNGLGNGSDVVGRHLMVHNNSSLIAISKTPNPTRFQKTLGVNDWYAESEGEDWPLGHIQMLGKSDPVLVGFDVPDAEDPVELASRTLDFWLTTEDLPLHGNRVTVAADGAITLAYEPTNLASHARLRGKLQGLLDTIRCDDELYVNSQYAGGRLGIGGVAHQNGTVRFGTDPTTSALDLDCRLHEVDNCYVVDASFFVSSTACNPTLTIIANAFRVADRIAERLGVPASVRAAPNPADEGWPACDVV